ncbi:MAG: nucleotidyltransferase domain-containing protein [Bacteroidales bacterium]|nr:nucleotidyltransferase domain-containing protein [Bacteroidales bacterium]
MLKGLKQDILDRLHRIFIQFNEIDKVILYGSRAKGNNKYSSDIDITLKGEGLSLSILNKVCTKIDDLLLPYTFDISIYNHLKNIELIDHIDRIGIIIYCKE